MLISATVKQDSAKAYQAGEFLKFRVHYSIFNAAFASLEVQNKMLNGRKHYHVVGKGNSAGALRVFYKVDDQYETYIDAQTGMPSKFIRNINEGGYKKNIEMDFNHENQTVKVNDKKHNKISYFDTEAGIQDMLSSFYHLRNVNTDLYKTGDFIEVDIFMDQEVFPFKLKVLAREKIRTKFGKINCIKIRPYVSKGRIFEANESVTMWISDDANHIPVKIKAKLVVGNISASLHEYKNLKHPIKFQ